MVKYALFLIILMLLEGCTTRAQSNPARTATEELLLSSATDRAAIKLALAVPKNAKVFVDSTNFEGTDGKYAVAAIRSHLLQNHMRLVNNRKNADVIVEIRAGALSTDRSSFMIGTPQFNIPIPLASSSLPFPQIALYSFEDQKGVAKFAMAAYDAKTGMLVDAQDPQYGFSHNIKKTLLFVVTWTVRDYMPEDAED
jgi:hypothetical protein